MASASDEKFLPFHRHDVSLFHPYELLKTVFALLFIFPVRAFFLIFWICVYGMFCFIGARNVKNFDEPIDEKSRWWIAKFFTMFDWILNHNLCDILNICLGIPFVKVTGDNSLVSKDGLHRANVIVSNHVSWIDIYLLMTTGEEIPGFVSKVEVKKVPLIGWQSQLWQCIYVDRSQKVGTVELITNRARDHRYPPTAVFPEGTTSNGKYLISFKLGAFVAGEPVKPVVIRYPSKFYSPAWESEHFHIHLLRALTQFANYAEVIYLDVYVPNEEEKKDPALYAENVRRLMAKELGVPLSDSSYDEKREYLALIRGQPAPARSQSK
eukprot:TRINITY_DN2865_c0_g1_i1.p1 TRINITY_DN2865_c0_g1~~TRINITY_DN2865_c0_g1_i1.p1  ORF type:complete len:335 (+),score=129.20 TRINITY_DN2865_c0_g1_i1:36-1007(+)